MEADTGDAELSSADLTRLRKAKRWDTASHFKEQCFSEVFQTLHSEGQIFQVPVVEEKEAAEDDGEAHFQALLARALAAGEAGGQPTPPLPSLLLSGPLARLHRRALRTPAADGFNFRSAATENFRSAATEGFLEVWVLSIEGLPHRAGAGNLWRPDRFQVKIYWPSCPYAVPAKLKGLEPDVWDEERTRLDVDTSAWLPWVAGQRSVTVSVHECDLVQRKRLVGEVEILLVDCGHGELRQFPLYGPANTIEGSVHLAMLPPEDQGADAAGADGRVGPRRRRPAGTTWWSPLCLCSSPEKGGLADTCS